MKHGFWMMLAVCAVFSVQAGEMTQAFDDDLADQTLLYETDFEGDRGWTLKAAACKDGKFQYVSGSWATGHLEFANRGVLGEPLDLAGKITAIYYRMTSDDANSKDQTIVQLISKDNEAVIGAKITYNIKNSVGTVNSFKMGFKDTADYSEYVQIRQVLDATEDGDHLWLTLDRYDETLKTWVMMAEVKVPAYTSDEELGSSVMEGLKIMLRTNDPIEDLAITQSK